MRYSEAVKRHKFETKQRIFNNIMAAAERENAARSYGSTNGNERYRVIDTENKETITMTKNTEINEIRSRRFGVIAAACAVLVIGGGVAMFANSGALKTDDTISRAPMTAAGNAEEIKKAETTVAESEAPATEENEAVVMTSIGKVDAPEVTTVIPEQTADSKTDGNASAKAAATIPEYKADFQSMLNSTEMVFLGRIADAVPMTVTKSDGSTQSVIRYGLTNCKGYYSKDNMFSLEDDSHYVYQPVIEGSAPQFKEGEIGLFMTQKIQYNETDMVDMAFGNGCFTYLDHSFHNVTVADDEISRYMKEYLMKIVLRYKDFADVYEWLDVLVEKCTTTRNTHIDGIPDNTTESIEWDESAELFTIDLNTPSTYSDSVYTISDAGYITNKRVSGFEDFGIELTDVKYDTANTLVTANIAVRGKAGMGFNFDNAAVCRLGFDRDSLDEFGTLLNVDAVGRCACAYGNDGAYHFTVEFDQAGTDGPVEFIADHTYKIVVNEFIIGNDEDNDENNESIKGEYEFTFKLVPNIAEIPNTRMVTLDTMTQKSWYEENFKK